MNLLPYAVAIWLLLIGLYGMCTSRNLIHLVVCLSVVQSATYIMLVSVGFLHGGGAPIYNETTPGSRAVDPVAQALVLTDLVVGATVSALMLSIAVQIHRRTGHLDPEEIRAMGEQD